MQAKDPQYQTPFIDADESRDEPERHRYVHGGFDDRYTEVDGQVLLPASAAERQGVQPSVVLTVDGSSSLVKLTASHTFTEPGSYFPALRVATHRHGGLGGDPCARIPNLGRVRVVVS